MKGAIKAVVLGLGLSMFAMGANADKITPEDVKDYAAEMPELSYQLPAIDCNDAAVKVGAMGAWWAIQQKSDVRNDPKRMAMYSTFEVLELTSKMDLLNFEYIDSDNLKKGSEEVLETYQGLFIEGAVFGAQVNKKLSLKEKREEAKTIGQMMGVFCKKAKEEGRLKLFIAGYRVSNGEF